MIADQRQKNRYQWNEHDGMNQWNEHDGMNAVLGEAVVWDLQTVLSEWENDQMESSGWWREKE